MSNCIKFSLLLLFLFFSSKSFSQKHDYIWFAGKWNSDTYGKYKFDFNQFPVIAENHDIPANTSFLSSTFCDKEGKLFCYTNGESIWDKEHEFMEGGDTINPGADRDFWRGNGLKVPKGAFFLPFPGHDSLICLVHTARDYPSAGISDDRSLMVGYYSVINKNKNSGLGKIIQSHIPLIIDTIQPPSAVRHANGRDWWIIFAHVHQHKYNKFLLTPDGFKDEQEQEIGTGNNVARGISRSLDFSRDGSRYIDYSGIFGFSLYDFDRCSGEFSNEYRLNFNDSDTTGWAYDAEFSSNNRFLYISLLWATLRFGTQPYGANNPLIIQYDLWADDLAASADTVGVNDSIRNPPWPIWGVGYAGLQTGPDGKIYTFTDNVKMQSIQEPNKKGKDCRVTHRFPVTDRGLSTVYLNYPNYRLGPLDGSPCDTLGINNNPIANYRYENWDTLDPLHIEFADLSYYEPAEWLWEFENLGTSRDTNPEFTFPAPGIYEVCLTVSNVNSSHQVCKNVPVGQVSDVEEAWEKGEPVVFPNPTSNAFQIYNPTSQVIGIQLFNVSGQRVFEKRNTSNGEQINVSFLPEGIYFYNFLNKENQLVKSGKLIISR